MSILRNNLQNKYSQIPNKLITDTSISPGAVRVCAYLFSKPDKWKVQNNDIKKSLGIGDSQTLANYLRELIEAGWVNRSRRKNDKGHFTGGYDYALNSEKTHNREKPILGKSPNMDKTHIRETSKLGKTPKHSNTDLKSNTEKESKKERRKRFAPPSLDQVIEYFKEKGFSESLAKRFFNYYESVGWTVGRNKKMKSWKHAAAAQWFPENKKTSSQENTRAKDYG